MKKVFLGFMAMFTIIVCGFMLLAACGTMTDNTPQTQTNDEVPRLSFIADFYENDGTPWLSVEGTTFDISPNKVKEYSYDSNGSWISQWTMSSVMTVKIDGIPIDTCGDTVVFSDSSLQRYEVELPQNITVSEGGNSSITTPAEIRAGDYWTIGWWWYNNQSVHSGGSKVVVIKSQTGKPICMYMGDNVTWEVARNLPKTTLVHIDGKALYIHRANFAVIDTAVFGG